uniref:Chemokine interleukin-8-like domain-containing protein n=1 Tax=Oncorhynchus mykiss TaxID=8022 RepID=A0A8K9XRT9_ONCMY
LSLCIVTLYLPICTYSYVEILPRGPHCKTREVIAGLVSGEKICLNSHSGWVKKLARFVVERHHHANCTLPQT